MISIDVIQRSTQMLLPDLDGCYWVISVHENTQTLLAGIELIHMICKGQYAHPQSQGLSSADTFYLLIA